MPDLRGVPYLCMYCTYVIYLMQPVTKSKSQRKRQRRKQTTAQALDGKLSPEGPGTPPEHTPSRPLLSPGHSPQTDSSVVDRAPADLASSRNEQQNSPWVLNKAQRRKHARNNVQKSPTNRSSRIMKNANSARSNEDPVKKVPSAQTAPHRQAVRPSTDLPHMTASRNMAAYRLPDYIKPAHKTIKSYSSAVGPAVVSKDVVPLVGNKRPITELTN